MIKCPEKANTCCHTGNNQQDIFVTDDDRYLFLDTIGQMAKRFDNDIFAYVLMDNHYHLLLRTQKARCFG